jgi:hypothetical protein
VSKGTSGILLQQYAEKNSQNVILGQITACSPWDVNDDLMKICK